MNSIRVRVSALVAALLLAVTGCAPGTPDEDSWRYDARRAVGDVVSAVQTARLVLMQSQEGRVHHAYLQNVLVDAERTGGLAAETLSSVQPPEVEGYDRDGKQGPWLLNRLVRRIHRHSGYVPMADVGPVDWEEQMVRIDAPLQPLDHP